MYDIRRFIAILFYVSQLKEAAGLQNRARTWVQFPGDMLENIHTGELKYKARIQVLKRKAGFLRRLAMSLGQYEANKYNGESNEAK